MPDRTILIVDDDEGVIDSLSARFDDQYDVLEARNVEAAISMLAQHGDAIDVVILDLTMPLTAYDQNLKKDAGMQVCRAARGSGEEAGLAPNTQFVALTAVRDVDTDLLTFWGIGTVIKGAPNFLERLDSWIMKACEHRRSYTGPMPAASQPELFEVENPDPVALFREALVEIQTIVDRILS